MRVNAGLFEKNHWVRILVALRNGPQREDR